MIDIKLKECVENILFILKLNGSDFYSTIPMDDPIYIFELIVFLCDNKYHSSIESLIDNGIDINMDYGDHNDTYLQCSFLTHVDFHNNVETLEFLLEHGIDINKKLKNNKSIFMFLDTYSNIEIIKLLIKYGADFSYKVNLYDHYGDINKKGNILDIFESYNENLDNGIENYNEIKKLLIEQINLSKNK